MGLLKTHSWRGPTTEEYASVRDIYKKTGILTVKDATTGHKNAKPYGEPYAPQMNDPTGAITGTALTLRNTANVRSVWLECVGSKNYPAGIAVGGVEVWVRDIPEEIGGSDFSVVDWRPDICTEELNRLRSFANDVVWVTNEMIDAADKENAKRREHKLETQQDPVGVFAKAFAEAQAKQPASQDIQKMIADAVAAALQKERAK